MYALAAAILFSPAILGGRLFFPIHTETMRPWREDVPADRLAAHRKVANEALTDQNFLFHPDTSVLARRIKDGELPRWNPTILGGTPFIGQALYGIFYPPNLLLLLIEPLERAYAWVIALHVALAGFGVFLLLTTLGVGARAAWLGGILFAVSGPMVVRYHYYMTFYPVVWIPYLLCSVHRFCQKPDLARAFLIPFFVALIFLSGFPQTGLYGMYLCFAYGAGRLVWNLRRKAVLPLLKLCAAFAAGGLFSAAQILPVAESLRHSVTRINDVDGLIRDSGSPWLPLGYLVPDLFQDPREPWSLDLSRNPLWSAIYCKTRSPEGDSAADLKVEPLLRARPNITESSCYAGAAGLLLAVAALFSRKSALKKLLLCALFVCWAYCLGFRPLVFASFYALPGLKIGEVRRILPTIALFLAMLAALGFDQMATMRRARIRLVLAIAATLLLFLGGLYVLLELSGPRRLHEVLMRMEESRYGRSLALSDSDQSSLFQFVQRRLLHSALWLAFATAAFAFSSRLESFGRRLPAILVVAAAALIDLCSYHFRYNPFVVADGFLSSHPLFEGIRESDGRVHRYEPEFLHHPLELVLSPNLGAHFGVDDAMGYIVAVPLRYALYLEALEPEHTSVVEVAVFPMRGPAALESPLIDGASIRYVLTRSKFAPSKVLEEIGHSPDRYRLVAQAGESQVHENLRAMPRVSVLEEACFLPPDSGDGTDGASQHAAILQRIASDGDLVRRRVYLEGPAPAVDDLGILPSDEPEGIEGGRLFKLDGMPSRVRKVRREAERIEIDLEDGAGGFLYVTDNFFPGWKATVDDRPVPILPANVAFRGLVLPRSARRVVMTYQPASVTLGITVSMLALASWLIGGSVTLLRARRGAS